MAIFTTLSVVIWFSTGTLEICATLVFTMRVVISDILSMTIVLQFVLYTILNFTTQCGANRHRYIANLATLIHKKKLIHCVAIFTILYGNYYPPHGKVKLICIGKFARRT